MLTIITYMSLSMSSKQNHIFHFYLYVYLIHFIQEIQLQNGKHESVLQLVNVNYANVGYYYCVPKYDVFPKENEKLKRIYVDVYGMCLKIM